jgi:hypothetical protein
MIGLGLLAMHALILVGPEHGGAHSTPRATPHAPQHSEAVHFDTATNSPDGHALHHCIWVLAAAIVLLAALGGFRKRRRHPGGIRSALARVMAAVERAPPSAVRLSLVGISRS